MRFYSVPDGEYVRDLFSLLQAANPNTSLPSDLSGMEDEIQALGVVPVQEVAPPAAGDGQVVEPVAPALVGGQWQEQWQVRAMTAAEYAAWVAALQARLTDALNQHLDAVARQRRYDNRFTCSLRAGFTGPFQAEGLAFAAWMDVCNLTAYQIMAEVKAGLRPIPTEEELVAEMPTIQWPPSPVPEGAL